MTARQLACWSLLVALGGCTVLEPPAGREPPPDLTLQGVRLERYQHGELATRGVLRELRLHRAQNTVRGDDVELRPIEDGQETGTLTAHRGLVRLGDGTGRLEGAVRWQAQDGERVDTEVADLDLRKRKASGQDGVVLSGDGYRLAAPRYEADLAQPVEVRLQGGVRGCSGDGPGCDPQEASR